MDFKRHRITRVALFNKKNMQQEPGANGTEIINGLKGVRPGNGFTPNFVMFNKIEVNGENQHPLYAYLKTFCPSPLAGFRRQERLFYTPFHNRDIRWNFEKFLVNKNGKPLMRYNPATRPLNIASDIRSVLEHGSVLRPIGPDGLPNPLSHKLTLSLDPYPVFVGSWPLSNSSQTKKECGC
ncbi:glutathione peroxidase-like isoform X3 [Limulus polyphemus]|uniref:Glutathione peroxidase-like isoform X3 n=1 Tax=Limulus polyphemus TaxID=6850 RepID=A0ABM1S7V0_LIMPO|nr:glutathione peroxidase-like isoform X3 [Limulus polyphemus]